ncbi:MAG: DUF2147 domain-containing protein [Verrucomicrobiota bacterium]
MSLLRSLIIPALLMMASLAHADLPIEGRWLTPKAEGTVEIKVDEGVLIGRLVASTNEKAKLGTVILRDFVRSGDRWTGKIYTPKHDRVLDAELSIRDGELIVKVSAGFRSKSVTWTRAT